MLYRRNDLDTAFIIKSLFSLGLKYIFLKVDFIKNSVETQLKKGFKKKAKRISSHLRVVLPKSLNRAAFGCVQQNILIFQWFMEIERPCRSSVPALLGRDLC